MENGNGDENNGNEDDNMEENDVNMEESNGNVDENNGNLEESNGNGNGNENNNEEAFNNNNDFNAVDNNIQQQPRTVPVVIHRPISPEYPVQSSEENHVSSTVEDSLSQNDVKLDSSDNVINLDSD